jgi:hypothetical protein
MATASRASNNITRNEISPSRETESGMTGSRSSAPDARTSPCCVSMPEVMRSSPMREENEAHHEHRHEEIILSDHDALLLLFPVTKDSVPLCAGE